MATKEICTTETVLQISEEKTTETLYVFVKGYIHPKNGGDDRPMFRGFQIPAGSNTKSFSAFITKKIKRASACLDFQMTVVSKEFWYLNFK